jgi:hypothetical protein
VKQRRRDIRISLEIWWLYLYNGYRGTRELRKKGKNCKNDEITTLNKYPGEYFLGI